MLKILVCDDEKSYAQLIKLKSEKILNELKIEYCIDIAYTMDDLKTKLNEFKYDIAFVDIMIDNENSLEWLKNNYFEKTQFIIMTAIPEEAYALSEINSCYFLIKSRLTDEMFSNSIKRAINNLTKRPKNIKLFKYKSHSYAIDINSILYVESFNNNIEINMINGEKIILYSTLKDFLSEMPINFIRCHKCYLVNMNQIKGYKPHCFIMTNNIKIPVPPKKYLATIEIYKNYLLSL